MKTIAHISDIHFGREDPVVVAGLLHAVAAAAPDVIVVSGDLTQRARKKQFRAARAFLKQLPEVPRIVVPGNHDVSLTSVVDRAIKPFARYKKFITGDLEPFFANKELAIAGINTVRRVTVNHGRIKRKHVERACGQLAKAGKGAARIIVTHHPVDVGRSDRQRAIVRRSKAAMKEFARSRVDLFLSGHLHTGRTLSTSAHYKFKGYSAVVVHAGTAVSTRRRGQVNAWNLIRIHGLGKDRGQIEVQPMLWSGVDFEPGKLERYSKSSEGWTLNNL